MIRKDYSGGFRYLIPPMQLEAQIMEEKSGKGDDFFKTVNLEYLRVLFRSYF